ncbi:MAG: 4-hydroxythreonine-4-phosphate dehydrogenase PdxA [Burkholderiales bacterium]|jgi:4-hydroxythreonine-4-phosphate dehydrogenase|nr:4-hydroxythreonine-4-phosphate dehydrogenase PdxA [Burkholderiales bacterium]
MIALTTGEPAGIGPEIALRAAAQCDTPVVLIGDAALLETTAVAIGVGWPLPRVQLAHVPLAAPCLPGRLDARNAAYVIQTLDRAIEGCGTGQYRAMVTAPLQKSVINAGRATVTPFSGHTEYLAERSGAAHVVMLLVGGGLRVALATTHLPLAAVPTAITPASLAATLDVLHHGLRSKFALPAPRIGVAGLNPHAGESGDLGREEIEVIAPAVAAARARGINALGPLPADTLFVPAQLARFDAVLAMYHDQGLPVLKHASFGHGVNVTLGLPFVRTSVDHGTALDLAGTGRADAGSMIAALRLAEELTA